MKTFWVLELFTSVVQWVLKWWKFQSCLLLPHLLYGKKGFVGGLGGIIVFSEQPRQNIKLKASLIISAEAPLRGNRAVAPPLQKKPDIAHRFHGWELLQRMEEQQDVQNFLGIHRRWYVSGALIYFNKAQNCSIRQKISDWKHLGELPLTWRWSVF